MFDKKKPITMKISMNVEGLESFNVDLEFKNTKIEVVKAVQNKIMAGLIELNNA
jgi:ribosomal protein L7/L12